MVKVPKLVVKSPLQWASSVGTTITSSFSTWTPVVQGTFQLPSRFLAPQHVLTVQAISRHSTLPTPHKTNSLASPSTTLQPTNPLTVPTKSSFTTLTLSSDKSSWTLFLQHFQPQLRMWPYRTRSETTMGTRTQSKPPRLILVETLLQIKHQLPLPGISTLSPSPISVHKTPHSVCFHLSLGTYLLEAQ